MLERREVIHLNYSKVKENNQEIEEIGAEIES